MFDNSHYATNFLGGFDKNFNIVFLKDATATESQKMHEASYAFFLATNIFFSTTRFFFVKKQQQATLLNLEYGWAKIATVEGVIEWLA